MRLARRHLCLSLVAPALIIACSSDPAPLDGGWKSESADFEVIPPHEWLGRSFSTPVGTELVETTAVIRNSFALPVRVEDIHLEGDTSGLAIEELWLSELGGNFPDGDRPPDWKFYSIDEVRSAGLAAAQGAIVPAGEDRRVIVGLRIVANDKEHSGFLGLHITFSSQIGTTSELLKLQLKVCHGVEGDACEIESLGTDK